MTFFVLFKETSPQWPNEDNLISSYFQTEPKAGQQQQAEAAALTSAAAAATAAAADRKRGSTKSSPSGSTKSSPSAGKRPFSSTLSTLSSPSSSPTKTKMELHNTGRG